MIFAGIFVLCVVYAIVSDVTRFRIPNIVSIVLLAAFIPYVLLGGTQTIWPHFAVAGAVFVVLFISFALGWLGAGDVKFVSAISLWAGPEHGPMFLVSFALLGGVLALMLLGLRAAQNSHPILATLPVLDKLSGWARNKILPYGLPIGLAALAAVPSIFAVA